MRGKALAERAWVLRKKDGTEGKLKRLLKK